VPFWRLDQGWAKNQDRDPGWTFLIIFVRAYKQFFGLKIPTFFYADLDPGSGNFFTPDPGWKNSDPGSGINNPDPQQLKNTLEKLISLTANFIQRQLSTMLRPIIVC
jgi:hypothetical protein